MNNPPTIEKELADKIFCEIGHFLVKFEHVCLALRRGISYLLTMNGLRNQQLAHIITADQTALPLKTILQAMIHEITKPEKGETLIIDAVFKRLQDLIETRNNVIHGCWVIGNIGNEKEYIPQAAGHKLIRKKNGARVKNFKYTAEDFTKLCNECTTMETMIDRLFICAISKHKLISNQALSDNFKIKGHQVELEPKK